MTLSLITILSYTITAQNLHNAKVLGIVNIGNNDVASIINLETDILYKTSAYSQGVLISNQDIQLEFNDNEESIKVLHSSSENILAFEELEENQDDNPINENNALKFDGVDDYIETSSSALDQITDGDFTFETWINGDENLAGNHPTIFCNRPNTSSGMKFFFHNIWGGASHKMLAVQLAGVNYFVLNNGTFNATLLDGTCHHVAITRAGDLLSFYADGVLFGTKTISGVPNIATGLNNRIGLTRGNKFPFNGMISDARIWNTARTNVEIAVNMNKAVVVKNNPNLVSYFKLNKGKNQSIKDRVSKEKTFLGSSNEVDNNDPNWIHQQKCEIELEKRWEKVNPMEIGVLHNYYIIQGLEKFRENPNMTQEEIFMSINIPGISKEQQQNIVDNSTSSESSKEVTLNFLSSPEAVKIYKRIDKIIDKTVNVCSLDKRLCSLKEEAKVTVTNQVDLDIITTTIDVTKASAQIWNPTSMGGSGIGDAYRIHFDQEDQSKAAPWVKADGRGAGYGAVTWGVGAALASGPVAPITLAVAMLGGALWKSFAP